MKPSNKAIILAPFWRMEGHVGRNRVDRFVRWLAADGYEVIVVCAGAHEGERFESWGCEISVVDRLGLYPERRPGQAGGAPARKPNRLRRALAYWLFNPDPGLLWARAAARHPRVRAATQGAAFILSSSPPESVHVGAWRLSRDLGVPHIMDLRDGWLDEPLKPLLLQSTLRRWQEGRLESALARDAVLVLVTSEVWKSLFDSRYPQLGHKVHVLTNAYPELPPGPPAVTRQAAGGERVLLHSGRFTGSRLTQSPRLLLEPLLQHLASHRSNGVIRFFGALAPDERVQIGSFEPGYAKIGWRFEFPGSLPRAELLEEMRHADGFLMLAATRAALPSKVFEYIKLQKPIFAVVEERSAAAGLCAQLPQCLVVSLERGGEVGSGELFYLKKEVEVPGRYDEAYLRQLFLDRVHELARRP